MNQIELITKLRSLSGNHKTLLIGVDGVGGSGKSTLARLVKENIPNVTIVQMDDFYSPTIQRADMDRVEKEVLKPLSNDMDCSYQVFDWRQDHLITGPSIQIGGIAIIEGVYSIHPQLAHYYDFKIWTDCSFEVGFKRGIQRDKIRDGVDNADKWLNIWMPDEKKYVDNANPQTYADIIIKT